MRSKMLLAFIVLGLFTANAEANEQWVLDRQGDICTLTRTGGEQEILVLHVKSPNEQIGDLFSFMFIGPVLRLASVKKGEEVRLIFRQSGEPSHIQMRITGKQIAFEGPRVQTFSPAVWMLDQLKTAGDFTRVDVEVGLVFETFDTTGLSTSLPALWDCAQPSAN